MSLPAREAPAAAGVQTGSTRPVIREATFEDYDSVAQLQIRNGLATMPREAWTDLWLANPVYRTLDSWPIGWVLEAEPHGVVGFIASIPSWFSYRGRNVVAAATGSWVTDPRYRGYSMMVLNAAIKRGGAELYLTNTANSISEATLRVLGWIRVPAGRWDRSHFWVASPYGFSRWFLAQRKAPLPGVAAIPAAVALRIHSDWVRRRSPIPALAGGVDLCAAFDARFDAFWEELQTRNPGVLLGLRSREALAWHFGGALREGKLRILTRGRNSRITAYAIFDQRDNLGLRRCRLVDFQALEDSPAALASFLTTMLREMRETKAHVLESAGYPLQILGEPERVAPYRRTLDAWKYYFKASNPELREALNAPGAWSPSYYDGDASL